MDKVIDVKCGAEFADNRSSASNGGVTLSFRFQWRDLLGMWSLTLKKDDQQVTVEPIMMVNGCELMKTPELGELYLVGDEPTLENFGKANTLVWRV